MYLVMQLLDKQCFRNNHVPVLVVQKPVKFFSFLDHNARNVCNAACICNGSALAIGW